MSEQLSLVRELVTSACTDPAGIVGSRLMAVIRAAFPNFRASDFDCLNLRDFVEQHVPEVKALGKSGMDYLYGLASVELRGESSPSFVEGATAAYRSQLTINSGSVWKAYASPSGLFKLYANTEDGRLIVCPPNTDQPRGPWTHIPPMPTESHLALAAEYVDSLADEGRRERLRQHFTDSKWWVPYYQDLKELGLDSEWNTLRRKRILGALEAALKEAGIPRGGLTIRAGVRRKSESSQQQTVPQAADSSRSRAYARALAMAIVQGMSLTELRGIRVRLGDVLDALDEA